jgi:hypothetical protein
MPCGSRISVFLPMIIRTAASFSAACFLNTMMAPLWLDGDEDFLCLFVDGCAKAAVDGVHDSGGGDVALRAPGVHGHLVHGVVG